MRTPVDPARVVAWEVLRAVHDQDAYANLVLPGLLRANRIDTRDAAFVTELTAGTLRRQGTYDAVLQVCLDRTLDSLDAGLLDALRLGVHQLLSMRVPKHAAVDTTVELVRTHVGHGPVGLANAVLRRVGRQDLATWVRQVAPDPDSDPDGFRVVATAHPRWVVEAFGQALADRRADELDDLLAADNVAPRVTLVARPGLSTADELGGEQRSISPFAVESPGGDPGRLPAVRQGRAAVQDAGSQLVALAAVEAPLEGRDERWLDLCAGPGGKSALLGAVAAQRGARLVAVEPVPHRAALVHASVRAVPPGVTGVVVADGTVAAWAPATFDRVLVDAPCSGLGALRRRPEARWRRRPQDVADLVPLQGRLLSAALAAVRPGGVVCYATCSPVLAETSGVVAAVLSERDDVVLEPVGPVLPWVEDADCAQLPGALQLWPHRHGTDAMFIALMRRV